MNEVRFDLPEAGDLPEVIAWMRVFYREEGFAFGEENEGALRRLVADGELGKVIVMRRNKVAASAGAGSEEMSEGVGYFLVTFGYSVERGGKTALLDELYVVPVARGRGIGKAAVAEAKRLAREAGCAAIFVEVDEGNDRARGLYEKSGFAEMGRDYLMAEI